MASWNPAQYLKFAGHRLRPALDLMARVESDAPRTVFDLGCGPGNVTRLLAERWPDAQVTGIDDSPEMLTRARKDMPALNWQAADLRTWKPAAPADMLYSNAVLHWLDGHETLFPHLLKNVAPGGVFAVQMPKNFHEPSHRGMFESAEAGPWKNKVLAALRQFPMHDYGFYYDLLKPLAATVDIWETVYVQALEGEDPVAEYTKGSSLKPALDALKGEEREAFWADYTARMRKVYPKRVDGRTLFPFRRLFIVARK